ncbi:mannose-1-phosphate guanylyltransferase/mannose-6-phosphate isomerase [Pandoraea sp.]|uniref:mannose-1-phosphate guanylyltransferase/mannose-6-phosphate isomerase n=1 Tax=Pandoraea sp. TaxID=1883445 RepID=UPI0011FB4670|nr:mannose-1-phosphate guanylyltransferase/mannose-6-phosphate isomerase [Pandoraea sp.]TAL55381.1 MAG: mannose-1-phosphate guanylyltransferase/mannose-6-phosphate isomerase [Pandoraea sp.]TAM15709.1 MAG: mannose-1-phosphate guanylyltransferase/mannose-6-phosphate isomerase [Pandoraea sp.]
MKKVIPVVLGGGIGTRLWPLSRAGLPKQFLVFSGTNSLFQQAIQRVNVINAEDITVGQTIVVANEEHRFLVLEQLRELSSVSANILLEPVGRNTAPALTLAALQASSEGDDPILVVTPADQYVADPAAFSAALQRAVRVAASGAIATLGVDPDRPETGYGYIRCIGEPGKSGEYAVAEFVEKPDIETARTYVASGDYAWNSGIFVLKASVWLNALQQFRADIWDAASKAWTGRTLDTPFSRPDRHTFESIPPDSIDYAVIEKCPGSSFAIAMVPLSADWSDLGAWDAVWQVGRKDQDGNVLQGDTLAVNTQDSVIYASTRLVATIGVSNLVVVETADAILVAEKSQSQQIKKIVDTLKSEKRNEHTLHRKVHRPWGWYDSIDEGGRFKVKRIQVKPEASLSLQMHHHRAEHWVVVSGTAEVTKGDKTLILKENQSIYIPLGEVHRLANPGKIPLELIEVQSGSYLGEDDIVRFDDNYGRH